MKQKEIELLKEISALAGTKDGTELIPLHRLQHLEKQKGECLVFSERQYPYFSNLADIDEYDKKEIKEIPMPKLDIHKTSFSIVNKIKENAERSRIEYFIWDGTHPTIAGHMIIAREWLKATESL